MKKILFSLLATFLLMGLVGAGSFALFQDTETSSGNIFQAGSLDLKLKDGGVDWTDSIPAEWTMTNMVPGVSTEYGSVDLKDAEGALADHLKIECSYTVDDEPDVESDTDKYTWQDPDKFAKYVEITKLIYYSYEGWEIGYYNTDWDDSRGWHPAGWYTLPGWDAVLPQQPPGYQPGDWVIDNSDGVEGISLADLRYDGLDNLPPPAGTRHTRFDLTLKFRWDAGNDLQGDTLIATMTFTLNGHSSQ